MVSANVLPHYVHLNTFIVTTTIIRMCLFFPYERNPEQVQMPGSVGSEGWGKTCPLFF